MKKIRNRKMATLAGIALLLISSCCKPEVSGNVANTLKPQETNNWCWAATTQMLAAHQGVTVTQCSLANQRFGRTDCCNPQNDNASCPKTNNCNMPGWLMLTECGLSYSETEPAMS